MTTMTFEEELQYYQSIANLVKKMLDGTLLEDTNFSTINQEDDDSMIDDVLNWYYKGVYIGYTHRTEPKVTMLGTINTSTNLGKKTLADKMDRIDYSTLSNKFRIGGSMYWEYNGVYKVSDDPVTEEWYFQRSLIQEDFQTSCAMLVKTLRSTATATVTEPNYVSLNIRYLMSVKLL